MMESLKKSWHELADSTPGKRFQTRYEKKKRHGRGGKPLWTMIAAIVLIAVGAVLLVIPGPGSVLIVLGAALLAEASLTVARGLDRAELRLRALYDRVRR